VTATPATPTAGSSTTALAAATTSPARTARPAVPAGRAFHALCMTTTGTRERRPMTDPASLVAGLRAGLDRLGSGLALRGSQQHTASPFAATSSLDDVSLGGGEPNHQGCRAALVFGEWWPAGARVHDLTIEQYTNFGKVLDAADLGAVH